MLSEAQLHRFNPWWRDPEGWEAADPHIRRLVGRSTLLPAPQADAVALDQPAIHVLRGPRQVGKSTDLKLLVRRALAEGSGSRQITYLSFDLLGDLPAARLVEALDGALELSGSAPGERLILLDEVTSAPQWRTALKAMWDDGRIDRDILVCTGSSAIDLAEGAAERLPGRRGSGRDFLILPQGFAAFARAVDPSIPPGPGLTVGELLASEGREQLRAARVHHSRLEQLLGLYLRFGGLPAAVSEAASGAPDPSEDTQRVLWDSLAREIQRRGASTAAVHALLERIMRSLGSKVSWSKLAREMDVPLGRSRGSSTGGPDSRTLQDYIELLALNYFAMVLYFWKPDSGSGDLSRDKKVYFGDPLLHTITAERIGLERDRHAEIENAIALALYQRYELRDYQAESMVAPERLHVWGTKSGGEIDFVCGPRDAVEAIEVADRKSLDRRKASAPGRALPGRPAIVATAGELELGGSSNLVPAALALWAVS